MKILKEFTKDEAILKILQKYQFKTENFLPILLEIQGKKNGLNTETLDYLANELKVEPSLFYGIATFYHFLNPKKKARYNIYLCRDCTCELKGNKKILKTLEKILNLKIGETSPDNKFSLNLTSCLGSCDKAPAMLINKDLYNKLSPKRIIKIIEKL
ncbi:MAG: NAD(P)H-dependent oxidoreductase subunit E [Armatimonadetes bacterium]|nr:NAD(P)H-dependent oxidoreductase subunit E [Armatimonadota bacterium]